MPAATRFAETTVAESVIAGVRPRPAAVVQDVRIVAAGVLERERDSPRQAEQVLGAHPGGAVGGDVGTEVGVHPV